MTNQRDSLQTMNLHEEVASGALVGSRRADEVVEVRGERHAYACGGGDVDAVTLPVAVGAEEDAEIGTLGQGISSALDGSRGEGRGGCREDGGKEGKSGGSEELHVEGQGRWTR